MFVIILKDFHPREVLGPFTFHKEAEDYLEKNGWNTPYVDRDLWFSKNKNGVTNEAVIFEVNKPH